MPPKKRNAKRAASPEKRPGGDEDPDLECGICTELLNDARQAPCCGALACCDCLDTAARKNRKCPFCRKKLAAGEGLRDVRMERQAANAIRGCPHDGCDFRGKRDKLKAHVEECDRRPSEEIIASLRQEIAALKREMAKQKKESAQLVAVHIAERDEAKRVAARYEESAIKYAFKDATLDGIARSLRAIDGRFAFKFEWSTDPEHEWSGAYRTRGGVKVALRVRKANRTLTLRLLRSSGDGDSFHERVEVVSPNGFAETHEENVKVPGKKNNVGFVRLPFSYTEFEKKFVHEGAFVISVTR